MDKILFISFNQPKKFSNILKKLGYILVEYPSGASLTESENTGLGTIETLDHLIAGQVLDAIFIEDAAGLEIEDICTFLANRPETKELPLLVHSERPATKTFITQLQLPDFEFLSSEFSLGKIASRIATKLRIRKMRGEDDLKANLGEMNAALRDFNQKVKKELEAARKIQNNLLPKQLPSDPSFEISVLYDPLDEVGGDWYYVERHTNGKLGFQIADVTGHGLSAAFICSMTKLAMAAAQKENPAELLANMNSLLAPQLPEAHFITAFSMLYCPETHNLRYARAGHPPALLFRNATKSVEKLVGDGFPLGFFDDTEYEDLQTALEPGDVVLLMTDGIPEAQNRSGQNYGEERIIEALSSFYFKNTDTTCAQILECLLDDFDSFREERILKDDLTLVALKIR